MIYATPFAGSNFVPPLKDRREAPGNEVARAPHFPAYSNSEKETYVVLLEGRELEHILGHNLKD